MFKKAGSFACLLICIVSTGINAASPIELDRRDFLVQWYSAPGIHAYIKPQPSLYDTSLKVAVSELVRPKCTPQLTRRRNNHTVGRAFGEIVSGAVKDVLVLHKNLFTWNSFKVITAMFPIFIGARMIDEKLQRCFYDPRTGKNINQPPDWCHNVAKTSIGVPLVVLGLDAFLAKDNDKRWTGQIMLLGMPFVIWTKKLVKQMKFDACLRPWHEKLTCGDERSFGGFPSGHMAQALYMAVLYGSRYGPRYALPLGTLAAFIGTTFVACNRHYVSQIVAGGVFGTIYALAASKLVDQKLADTVKLGISVDEVGHPTFSAKLRW